MMLAAYLLLLYITAVDGESFEKCGYQDVLNYLNLTKNSELFSMSRPVKNHTRATKVKLSMLLYAILDVREIAQTFVPYVWIEMLWNNEHISWDPADFCGITEVPIPTEVLWMPDITIAEMTEKDNAPPSPYLIITHDGHVRVRNDQVLVSTCRMHVYKFPFDTQRCSLSFKSVIHSAVELKLSPLIDSSHTREFSEEVMRIQYEWLFIDMTVTNRTDLDLFANMQDIVIYTITMKRRPVLYVVNFLLPVMFFFCLDLATFLMSDTGGEKLGFKITVLLAVTVMQLLLNEILPTSSDRIPLIAVYCIGIFGLMMLSLLETILVMHLIEKDSAYKDNETGGEKRCSVDCDNKGKPNSETDEEKLTESSCDLSADERPTELLKGSSSKLTESSRDCVKCSDERKELLKTLALLLDCRKKGEGEPGYWTKKAKTIHKVFFIFYIIAASLFFFSMFVNWRNA